MSATTRFASAVAEVQNLPNDALDSRRAVADVRRIAAEKSREIAEDWRREKAPLLRLADKIADARASMGEQRWGELQAEWGAYPAYIDQSRQLREGGR